MAYFSFLKTETVCFSETSGFFSELHRVTTLRRLNPPCQAAFKKGALCWNLAEAGDPGCYTFSHTAPEVVDMILHQAVTCLLPTILKHVHRNKWNMDIVKTEYIT